MFRASGLGLAFLEQSRLLGIKVRVWWEKGRKIARNIGLLMGRRNGWDLGVKQRRKLKFWVAVPVL